MPIPFKLDYTIAQLGAAQIPAEQLMLVSLTGIEVSAVEAQRLWSNIQEHKWYLSECLGRDVGLRVAVVDYCENIEPF